MGTSEHTLDVGEPAPLPQATEEVLVEELPSFELALIQGCGDQN